MRQSKRAYQWYVAGPPRALRRMLLAVGWIALCWTLAVSASLLRPFATCRMQHVCKRLSKLWIRGVLRITGIRIKVEGEVPAQPYFLVANHITWADYFVMNSLVDAVCVVQAEDEKIPVLGRLMKGLNPVFVRRTRDDIARTVNLMTEHIRKGRSLLMAPEGIVSPGKTVRRFRPALLESAVLTETPVHYASITCRTPEGYPPASRIALFGPDPYYRTPDGKIPDSELEAWGPERSFLWHLLRLLSLPWHEFTVRFAPEPVSARDRHVLANNLQQAVSTIFTPVQ